MSNTIAIIIPCFNGWKYIKKCLESLEHQSVLPDQVIIGDDCSTDNSFDKLTEYKNNSKLSIFLFRNDKNYGPGFTRKKALEYVQSDFCAFCDCDDWYDYSFVETIKSETRINSLDLLIFDNYIVYKGKTKKAGSLIHLLKANKTELLALYQMSLWRLCVSSSIAKQVFFPPLYYGEDVAVAIQIIQKSNTLKILDKPLYYYFIRNNSTSSKPNKNVYKSMLDSFSFIETYLNVDNKNEVEFIGIKMVCYGATLNALKSGISFKIIKKFIDNFSYNYNGWHKNKYMASLNLFKRLFVNCARKKHLFFCLILSLIHKMAVRAS